MLIADGDANDTVRMRPAVSTETMQCSGLDVQCGPRAVAPATGLGRARRIVMLPPSGLSRRALVAGAAVAAVASVPDAAARKRKPPPLAFYAVTMTGVSDFASGNDRAFIWNVSGAIYHPESDSHFPSSPSSGIAANLTAKTARAALIKQLQGWARTELQGKGQDVPADQIEVILI
jgi:hypothetical protein